MIDTTDFESEYTNPFLERSNSNDLPIDESDPENEKYNVKCDGCIKILNVLRENACVLSCKYSEDGKVIAAGLTDGILSLYNIDNGEHIGNLVDDEVRGAALTHITHRNVLKDQPLSHCFICSYSNGFVKCWNIKKMQCVYTVSENRQVYGVEYHPKFKKFLTYGEDGKIHYYDEETKKVEQSFYGSSSDNVDGHTSRIFSASFHPTQFTEFVSGGWDDVVLFWDTRRSQASRHLSGIHICADGVKISPNGQQVFTCSFQKNTPLELWDYNSMRRIFQMEPDIYKSKVYCGKFVNVNYSVTGGCDLNLLRVIDMKKCLTVGYLKGLTSAIYCVDVGLLDRNKGKARFKASLEDFVSTSNIIFCSGKSIYEITYIREVT